MLDNIRLSCICKSGRHKQVRTADPMIGGYLLEAMGWVRAVPPLTSSLPLFIKRNILQMGPFYYIIPCQDPDSGSYYLFLRKPLENSPFSQFSPLVPPEFSFCNKNLICNHLIWWLKTGNGSSLLTVYKSHFVMWKYKGCLPHTTPSHCAQDLTKVTTISCTHHVFLCV